MKKRKSPKSRKRNVECPSATGKAIYGALLKLGFELDRIVGSHHKLRWPGASVNELIDVPVHSKRSYPPYVVKDYWKQAKAFVDVSLNKYVKLVRRSG